MHQPGLFDAQEEEKPERVSLFDDGPNCPVPTRFPTGGGHSIRLMDRVSQAEEEKDWRALDSMKAVWWCLHCKHWHRFSARFFAEFKGLYPHQYAQRNREVTEAQNKVVYAE